MTEKLPAAAGEIAKKYPDVWKAYASLGEACAKCGPADDKTMRLVKLALAVGAASEGAVHSHARRALDEGVPGEEIKQVAMFAITTLGFPRAVAAFTWIEDVIGS